LPRISHYDKDVLRIIVRVLDAEPLGTGNSEQPKICGIVLEFPGPVFQFCAGGKNFNNQARRLEKITCISLVG